MGRRAACLSPRSDARVCLGASLRHESDMSRLSPTQGQQADLVSALEQRLDEAPEQVLEELRRAPPEELLAGPLGLVHAHALRAVAGPLEALTWLTDLVQAQPDDPDAWHLLGRCYEELNRPKAVVRCYLRVLELDARLDERAGFDVNAENERVLRIARRLVERLPQPFRRLLEPVPMVIQARPDVELVQQGFDPRSLGCFEGPTHGDTLSGGYPQLTQITLFSASLIYAVPPDDDAALRDEIEITILHEIGHFFDLDDVRLEELGIG